MIRKEPVYLLIDVSDAMRGELIAEVQNRLEKMISEVFFNDPMMLEGGYVSVITFSDIAKQLVPLTELTEFKMPLLTAGGQRNLGKALEFVNECIEREVRKSTAESRGDFTPVSVIITAGPSTDDIAGVKTKGFVIGVPCNDSAEGELAEIAQESYSLKYLQNLHPVMVKNVWEESYVPISKKIND